jgi:hypothetical protein
MKKRFKICFIIMLAACFIYPVLELSRHIIFWAPEYLSMAPFMYMELAFIWIAYIFGISAAIWLIRKMPGEY